MLGKDSKFPSEPERYHLFVALNCPWCHRVTLARNILGLQESVTMDIVFPNQDDPDGSGYWEFNPTRTATLTASRLKRLSPLPLDWQEQFELFKRLA